MRITLNDKDCALARKVGLARYLHYKALGRVTLFGRSKGRGPEENYANGIGAEIAFCNAYGVRPMLSSTEGRHYDAVLVGPCGERIEVDVKSRDVEGSMSIKRKDWESRVPDLFAFVIGTLPDFRIVGFICASRAMDEEHMDYKAERPCYKVRMSELRATPW